MLNYLHKQHKCVIFDSSNKQKTTTMATQKQIELGEQLKPLTDLAAQMIIAGTLKKNVIKHFTNKGLSFEAAENITEVGIFKAEELQKLKAK